MTRTTLLGLLLFAQATLAQQAVIDHCRKTSSDADRIACLEAALMGREPGQPGDTQSQVDPPGVELGTAPPDDEIDIPAKSEPVGIGASQVVARTQTREDILDSLEQAKGLVVAGYDVVPYERLLVTLENGQVWRQIKGDTQKLRVDLKRNQTVDISESSLGGYKLRLNEMRRTVRVERVR